jgi:putative spermidine/putrescine transport system substrate-binding protein
MGMLINRRFLILSTTFALAWTGAHADDATVSGTVTLGAYSSVFQDKYTAAVVKPFMAKYPKVQVTYYPIQNSAQLLGLLRAQKSSPQIDVAVMDVTLAKIGSDEGLFAQLDPQKIPALADLYDVATIPGVFGRAVTLDHIALVYNTDAIKSPPKSWEALWDPAYRGRVVVEGVPDTTGILLTIIANQLAGGDPNPEKLYEKGIAKMVELSAAVQTWDPKPNTYPHIINQTGYIGAAWNARSQFYNADSQGKIAAVLPAEGSIFQLNFINLVANSPNRAAADLFINYALSPDAQQAFSETMYYAPTNKKTEVSPQVLERTAAGKMENMIAIDWLAVAKIRDRLSEQWRRRVIPASR